jgi:hypothetical protein
MSLETIVYNFAEWLVAEAAEGAAVAGAVLHADTYEEMNDRGGTRYIRIDNLLGSAPKIVGAGTVQDGDALLDVQFLVIPATQKLSDRLAARNAADAMANEFVVAVYENRTLRVSCEIVRTVTARKANDYRKVGNVKTPISIVRLTMNQDL